MKHARGAHPATHDDQGRAQVWIVVAVAIAMVVIPYTSVALTTGWSEPVSHATTTEPMQESITGDFALVDPASPDTALSQSTLEFIAGGDPHTAFMRYAPAVLRGDYAAVPYWLRQRIKANVSPHVIQRTKSWIEQTKPSFGELQQYANERLAE